MQPLRTQNLPCVSLESVHVRPFRLFTPTSKTPELSESPRKVWSHGSRVDGTVGVLPFPGTATQGERPCRRGKGAFG